MRGQRRYHERESPSGRSDRNYRDYINDIIIEIILMAKIIRIILRTEVQIAYMRDMELLGDVHLLTLR